MSHLKNITIVLLLIATAATLTMCKTSKPAKYSQKMNYEQFSKEFGSFIADKAFDQQMEADPTARGGKKPKQNAMVTVWFYDIMLNEPTLNLLETDITPNAQWAAITKFVDSTSNDGAYTPTGCNWNFNSPPGAGVKRSCNADGTGFYRSFTSDFPFADSNNDLVYLVHVSIFYTKP